MIFAEIVKDSIHDGDRITTWVIQIPKFINAEFNTHRVFSRNFASSRAIPTKTFQQRLLTDPVIPVEWGKNKKGMSASSEIEGVAEANRIWLQARDSAISHANELYKLGVHKQIVNRILEPWVYQVGIVTATDLDNFFYLRCSPEAQPEIRTLANQMRSTYETSAPTELKTGQWHIPLVEGVDLNARKIAVARCARVSYATNHRLTDSTNDIALFDQLKTSGHWSPFEHVARAKKGRHANFNGWEQFRHVI